MRHFSLDSKARVVCAQCRTLMALKGAMPQLGLLPELRMFQCRLCDNVETRAVEARKHPAASGASRWQ
jgi:hypothetical protein